MPGDELELLIAEDRTIEPPEREYHFAPVDRRGKHVRGWRFDFAWPHRLVALEIDGGVVGGGRHGGQPSALRDIEKRAVAACLGWRVIPVTPWQATDGTAIAYLRAALGGAPVPM